MPSNKSCNLKAPPRASVIGDMYGYFKFSGVRFLNREDLKQLPARQVDVVANLLLVGGAMSVSTVSRHIGASVIYSAIKAMRYASKKEREMNEKAARTIQTIIVDGTFTLAGLAASALGVWYVWEGNAGLAATGLGGGLVLLFAATIHRFESLKGLGMEAKTKELKFQVDKAERALAQLRDLAEFTGTNLLRMVSAGGRHGSSTSMDNSYKVSRDVKKLFVDASSKPETVRTALEFWARYAAIDMFSTKLRAMQSTFESRIRQMGEDAAKLQGDDCADLMRRAQALREFQLGAQKGLGSWELHEFPSRLQRIVEEAPDLLSVQREQWRVDFAPAIAQLRYLADNLDYGDHEYWSEISRKRG